MGEEIVEAAEQRVGADQLGGIVADNCKGRNAIGMQALEQRPAEPNQFAVSRQQCLARLPQHDCGIRHAGVGEHGSDTFDSHDVAAIDIARTLDRLQCGKPAAGVFEAGGTDAEGRRMRVEQGAADAKDVALIGLCECLSGQTLDTLVDECERLGADVVSAISPLKSAHGLTSCGIGDHKDRINPLFRFTLKELEEGISTNHHERLIVDRDATFIMRDGIKHHQIPSTFNSSDAGFPDHPLMINTGCWIADLRKDWCSATEYYEPPQGSSGYPQRRLKVSFNCISHIYAPEGPTKPILGNHENNRPHPNNRTGEKYYVDHDSEDWRFSWMLWDWKCKVYATRVFLDHVGEMRYPNRGKWGTLDHDEPLAYKEKR